MKFHTPVLLPAVEKYLINQLPGIYVDATIGGGGYESYLLNRYKAALKIIGIDLDKNALAYAKKILQPFESQVLLSHGNFRYITRILNDLGIDVVDGILFDLGVSSYQLDTPARGFSYRTNGPLDLRMDADRGVSAREVIAEYGESDLADLFWTYGEERNSRRIARAIVLARKKQKITTTLELAQIIRSATPASKTIKTVTRCFQALRYKINDELTSLQDALEQVPTLLKNGGRLVVICYESLTDRIVKTFLLQKQKGCECPSHYPTCVCGVKPTMKIITKRPVLPSPEEIARNKRARRAKLRCGEKLSL